MAASSETSFDWDAAMNTMSSPISSPAKATTVNRNKRARTIEDDGEDDLGDISDDNIDPILRNEGPAGPSTNTSTGNLTSQNLSVFAK